MRAAVAALVTVSFFLSPGCGGGSGDGGVLVDPCLSFSGAQAPAPGQVVTRLTSGGSCRARFVEIVVTDVSDVFSGSFTVNFDATKVAFGNASGEGSFLAAGGTRVNVVQSTPPSGSVTIGITRVGVATGVNVTSPQVLVKLSFAPLAAGNATMTLTGAQLFGSETPPLAKSGLTWTGGTFQVQ
jgi:hypothetical protein